MIWILALLMMIILIMFASGFVIINRYYKKEDLSTLERAAYTISLSLAIAIIIGLFLGYAKAFNMKIFLMTYAIIIFMVFILGFLKK